MVAQRTAGANTTNGIARDLTRPKMARISSTPDMTNGVSWWVTAMAIPSITISSHSYTIMRCGTSRRCQEIATRTSDATNAIDCGEK